MAKSNVGLQFSLELTKILPVKETVQNATSRLMDLARSLKRSGSDLVIEEDLAWLIGRLRVNSELEHEFKNDVVIQGSYQFNDTSEVFLARGAGPTVLNGVRNREYLSSIIQLSFLCSTHSREDIAYLIATAMEKRFHAGVPGASLDPGYERIEETLDAITSQTTAFNWSRLTREVEVKLESEMKDFRVSPEHYRLAPSLVTGALDALHAVQSLPEDRKIVISNENGAITFIVWAYYLLGLDVSIDSQVDQPIHFERGTTPQVIICWRNVREPIDGQVQGPRDPEISLLDTDSTVVLRSFPDESTQKGATSA